MTQPLYTCSKCNGKGYIIETYEFRLGADKISLSESKWQKGSKKLRCDKCWGHKKLDWIENITGKKKENHYRENGLNFQYDGHLIRR